MENPITQYKKELIEWIKNLDDLEVLSQLVQLKEKNTSIPSVSEPQAEYSIKDDFDERFAKGITADELLEGIFQHIDSLPWEEK